jgi:phosphoribosyl 1,2-cyclic phosphate phosphodiesterase
VTPRADRMRVTILGCGASGGVPRADGGWGACDPHNPRNRRMRCGVLIQAWRNGASQAQDATTILIDTPPELRLQLLAVGPSHLDAVIFTHEHADQCHGLDDVRPFAQRQRRAIPTFMDARTAQILTDRFDYIFRGVLGYPAIMALEAPLLAPLTPFEIDGPGGRVMLLPLLQDHGVMPSMGFRIGAFAYCNDVVRLPAETLAALHGLDVFVVDALRYEPHPTHANVAQALEWIGAVQPKRAVLTNLHIDLDYAALAASLPPHVMPAHDGLTIELAIDPMTDCT